MVVYWGWFGHLGKIAPLVMTISAPQQTLLYTPKVSFTAPFCGTDSLLNHERLYIRISMSIPQELDYHSSQDGYSPGPKMSTVRLKADA